MNSRHLYEYSVNPHTAAEKVVHMVGMGKRVLEIGSGPGSITRLLKNNKCRVTALELDPKAIEIVAEYCEDVYPCDLNDPEWPKKLPGTEKFEVIVAGDVLEHLYAPWTVLNSLHTLLAEDGYVVISLPHVGHNAVVACLLAGDFEYRPWGLLDKTHIRFFGIANIQRLFDDAGFKILEAGFVTKTPEQTEFSDVWRRLPASTQQALRTSNKFGNVYQVVIKAVPKSASGQEIQLASTVIPLPQASFFDGEGKGSRALRFLVSFLSLRTRQRISHAIRRIGIRF